MPKPAILSKVDVVRRDRIKRIYGVSSNEGSDIERWISIVHIVETLFPGTFFS